MKRQLVGLIVLLVVFTGMLTTILVNSKYIFRTEPYYSETQVEEMCDDAYKQSIKDNSDQALYNKMSELTIKNLELVNQNETLTSEKTELQSIIESNNLTIADLELQVTELQANKTENEALINELNLQIDELDKQNKLLAYEISQKDEIIEQNNKTITQLQNSIAYYEEFISGLETDYEVVAIFIVEDEVFNIQKLNKNGLAYLEKEPTVSENCIFNGWKVNDEIVDLTTYKLTCNTTFVADLSYTYKVDFIVDDLVYNSQTILENNYVLTPETPIKDGYNFVGWSLNQVDVIENIDSIEIVKNITYYAIFIPASYTVLETSFNGCLDNFSGAYVWNVDNTTFYSKGTSHYILDKETKTWNEFIFSGLSDFNGSAVVNLYGDYYYFDDSLNYYKLNKDNYSWEYVTTTKDSDVELSYSYYNIQNFWTNNVYIFYSYCSYSSGINIHFKLDFATNNWSTCKFFKSDSTTYNHTNYLYFSGSEVFKFYDYCFVTITYTKSSSIEYHSFGSLDITASSAVIYYQGEKFLITENRFTTNSLRFDNIDISRLWCSADKIYYSYGSKQYEFNFATNTFIEVTWNINSNILDGYYIWTDGENYYYSYGDIHYQIYL